MDPLPFLPYAKQSIDASDIDAVASSLREAIITRGPHVEAFEKEIANYCGARFGVAFNSGTTALTAAYYAAQTGPYDRVITTPNTFVGTVTGGIQFQATPVLVDIDLETGCLNLDQAIQNANAPQSRGRPILVPVHLAGLPVDIQRLDSELTNPEAIIIEDAAHAIGTSYSPDGPKVGSCAWSQMTVFSFHPAKTMTTGEGGLVTTQDEELCHRLRLFRNNGIVRDPRFLKAPPQPWTYEVCDLTTNTNFVDMQAALGISQLKRLELFIEKRRQLMRTYRELLAPVKEIQLLTSQHDQHTAFHLCVALIDFDARKKSRAEVMTRLKERGIGTQVHYIPLYRHPYFVERWGEIQEFFPHTETYYSRALSLPLFYDMTLGDVERVVKELKACLRLA